MLILKLFGSVARKKTRFNKKPKRQRRRWIMEISYNDWCKEGEKRYGSDRMKWRFRCPSCDSEISVQDYKDAGAPEDHVGMSCVGRSTGSMITIGTKGKGPCNYAGFGLMQLNPVTVLCGGGVKVKAFDFADDPMVCAVVKSYV